MNKKLFKLYYNPMIIGSIPDNGPIILCGNNYNEKDASLVNSSVKRRIFWIENDENKAIDVLNNGGIVGMFPERRIDEYQEIKQEIRLLEKQIIKLNNNKHMRGTECMTEVALCHTKIQQKLDELNKITEELRKEGINIDDYDVILPFSNEVVSIAKKTNVQVVPFAVTGNYVFNSSNLKIRYGEPVTIQGNDEEETIKLQNKVRKLIYKNY